MQKWQEDIKNSGISILGTSRAATRSQAGSVEILSIISLNP